MSGITQKGEEMLGNDLIRMKKEGKKAFQISKTLKGKVGIGDTKPPAIVIGEENLSDLLTELAVACYGKEVEITVEITITL